MPNTLGLFTDKRGPVSAYTEAVNASRFVKGFGITALVYSLLLFAGINLLGAGIGLGTGLFILRYDNQTFYRRLGIILMVAAIVPITLLSPLMLSGAVFWKGRRTLDVLSKEGKDDKNWESSRKRAWIGTVASGAGIGFSFCSLS